MTQTPKRLGCYELGGVIGRGGMAEVFVGHHPILERRVAIKKVLRRTATHISRVEMLQRFFLEGRSLAQLSHRSIVAVYDLIANDDDVYMVLEYVDGSDLGTVLRGGPLPADVAAIVGINLSSALETAHFHRIIHRDIKPANVMLSKRGDVKLMDFGIVRTLNASMGLTSTGIAMGTPMYMAPEVIRGNKADERADIFSVGALLYQSLCGRPPFEDPSYQTVLRLIIAGKYTKAHAARPGVPRRLSAIVDRCLVGEPEARYQSAADLRVALETFLASYSAYNMHASRLVACLYSRGLLQKEEALASLDEGNLTRALQVKPRHRRPILLGIGAGLAAVLLGLLAWAVL